jgi:Flp pilus assembly protein TadD
VDTRSGAVPGFAAGAGLGYNGCVTHKPGYHPLITVPALLLLALGLVVFLRPIETPYLDLLQKGDEHAVRAERAAAVAAYQEAAHLQPEDPTPHLRQTQVYLDWGRADDALAAVTEAERRGAEKPEVARLQIAIHIARADWLDVAVYAKRLLALTPADAEAHHTLARAYIELQAWDAARAEYETLLHVDPDDVVAHERLGVLLLGADPAAIQHLLAAQTGLAERLLAVLAETSATDDPAYTSALVGRVLFEAAEWPLAAREFERALAYNPRYPDAHAYLGHALDQMDRSREALAHLRQAVALAPDSAAAHTFLGLYYDRRGDLSAARAAYEAAYDLDPENPATCIAIGQTWVAEDRYVAAEIWLRQAVTLEPDDAALWEVLARFYLDHSITAHEWGVEATTKLVELSPNDAQAHDLRGRAAIQVGDYETAQESLLRAISLDPMLASAHYHLGQLRFAQGDSQQAREAYLRALDLDTSGELAPLVERALGGVP